MYCVVVAAAAAAAAVHAPRAHTLTHSHTYTHTYKHARTRDTQCNAPGWHHHANRRTRERTRSDKRARTDARARARKRARTPDFLLPARPHDRSNGHRWNAYGSRAYSNHRRRMYGEVILYYIPTYYNVFLFVDFFFFFFCFVLLQLVGRRWVWNIARWTLYYTPGVDGAGNIFKRESNYNIIPNRIWNIIKQYTILLYKYKNEILSLLLRYYFVQYSVILLCAVNMHYNE